MNPKNSTNNCFLEMMCCALSGNKYHGAVDEYKKYYEQYFPEFDIYINLPMRTSVNPNPGMQPLAAAIRDISILQNAKRRSLRRDCLRLPAAADTAAATTVGHDCSSPHLNNRALLLCRPQGAGILQNAKWEPTCRDHPILPNAARAVVRRGCLRSHPVDRALQPH